MSGDDWQRLEYEEINRYGRSVYETILRLAQMTFVINPALAAGFYYIYYEKAAMLQGVASFGIALAVLGIVYNLGARGVYVSSHAFLEKLLIRMREIDETAGTKLHSVVEVTAPFSYRKYWGKEARFSFASPDRLTRFFLALLALCWALALFFAIARLRGYI